MLGHSMTENGETEGGLGMGILQVADYQSWWEARRAKGIHDAGTVAVFPWDAKIPSP